MTDLLSNLNLGNTAEVAAIVAVTGLATQLLKKKTSIKATYIPWVAFVLGGVIGAGVFAWYGDASYLNGILLGALSGGSTAGLFDGLQPAVQSVATSLQASKDAKTVQAQTAQEQGVSRAVTEYLKEHPEALLVAAAKVTSQGGESTDDGSQTQEATQTTQSQAN